jgi:hypothetical protein
MEKSNTPRCGVAIAPVLKKTSERLIFDSKGNLLRSETTEEGKEGKTSMEQLMEARGKKLGLKK